MKVFSVRLASVTALMFLSTTQFATATPNAACLKLAKQFGEKPESLDTSELAKLRTCVTEVLDSKLDTPKPAPAMTPH